MATAIVAPGSASAATASSPAVRSQYHHFIPRFILRNFGDSSIPLPRSRNKKKKGKNKAEQSTDAMLNLVDLNTMELSVAPLSRAFGLIDMYRDFDGSNETQYRIEQKLSVLESKAGKTIAAIRRAFGSGNTEVRIMRTDLDNLRKFLFIMMYRNKKFQSRFNHSTSDYFANDNKEMMEYIQKKGYSKPIDVWFDTLEAIMDLDQSRGSWDRDLLASAYPGDALWFIKNVGKYFMCLVTPSDPGDEFVLAENTYGVYEGPSGPNGWTDHHLFAPITPKLMILLRSGMLSSGYDEDEEGRKIFRAEHDQTYFPGQDARSLFEDIPVKKATNNYSRLVDGKPQSLPGPMLPYNSHEFTFPFFSISTADVQTMNVIFIENAFTTNLILFKSRVGLRKVLENYLTTTLKGFKYLTRAPGEGPFLLKTLDRFTIVPEWPDDAKLVYLKGLEKIAGELGSTAKLRYQIVPGVGPVVGVPLFNGSDFMKRHAKLGGSKESFGEDFAQVHLLTKMHFMIDRAAQSAAPTDLNLSNKIRHNRRNFLYSLPTRRVWLFAKWTRVPKGNPKDRDAFFLTLLFGEPREGPEDVIADARKLFATEEALARNIVHAYIMDGFVKSFPDAGLVGDWLHGTPEEKALKTLKECEIVFEQAPGSLRTCGIPKVEERAKYWYNTAPVVLSLRRGPMVEKEKEFLSEDECFELVARARARDEFQELLSGSLPTNGLKALEKVFFDLLYKGQFWSRARRTENWWRAN